MVWIADKISELLRSRKIRNYVSEVITHGIVASLAMAFAVVSWKAWAHYSGTQSPMIVVVSESMEPAIKRGDILFVSNNNDPIRAGEIVMFVIDGYPVPIVHRVIEVHQDRGTAEVNVLTKGDNNEEDDRMIYVEDQQWVQRDHIMGRAVGFLPYAGWINLAMFDN